ncbi:MAG: RNA pseudouridine synthase [Myxococcaceae bacterium]|nr:RNA pseudouridine synthase [Myxococcaceae bacterium]
MTLRVLLAHPQVVVVDKPAGVPVIPGRDGGDCVRAQLEAQLGRSVWVVHRLDRDTTGALAFALDADTHRALNGAFEHGEVGKSYLALVEGVLASSVTVERGLVKIRGGKVRLARPGEQGLASRTDFTPVEALRGATLVRAVPHTGRTHQIRVHLASLGHPLLVDHQYGHREPRFGLARTPLHASTLSLPLGGVRLEVEAPLPGDLAEALATLRQA